MSTAIVSAETIRMVHSSATAQVGFDFRRDDRLPDDPGRTGGSGPFPEPPPRGSSRDPSGDPPGSPTYGESALMDGFTGCILSCSSTRPGVRSASNGAI